jgi:hypothetical protein
VTAQAVVNALVKEGTKKILRHIGVFGPLWQDFKNSIVV